MATVWQVGSGEAGRRYHKIFLDHDVMLCGPGDYGPFNETNYRGVVDKGECTATTIGGIRQFAQNVQSGDLVLLRSGHSLVTIGIVASVGYVHNPTFDDVYGWDLQHTQRIIWQEQMKKEVDEIQNVKGPLFGNRKHIPTFTAVRDVSVLSPINHLFSNCLTRPLKKLPDPPSDPITLDKLATALVDEGLPCDAIQRVKVALDKQQKLLRWYDWSGLASGRPGEHEVVAHIIVPLLMALGWSEQLLAVEWHKIDLAVFKCTPTDKLTCVLVCEAKKRGGDLQNVLQQAVGYVQSLDLSACNKILLADGGRFYLYARQGGEWHTEPSGYMNVEKLRERHVFPSGTNAVKTLIALTPAHMGH